MIGRLLALTPNEEVNSLAALHFAGLFGRENVFQLTPEPHGAATSGPTPTPTPSPTSPRRSTAQLDAAETHEPGRAVALELHGRVLFGPGMTYTRLALLLAEGATLDRLDLRDGDPPPPSATVSAPTPSRCWSSTTPATSSR